MSNMLNPIYFPEPKSEHSQVRGLILKQLITRTPSNEHRVVEVQGQNDDYLIRLIRERLDGGREEHSFVISKEDLENSVDRTIPSRYFLERTPLILDEETWVIEGLAARIHYLIMLHKNWSK